MSVVVYYAFGRDQIKVDTQGKVTALIISLFVGVPIDTDISNLAAIVIDSAIFCLWFNRPFLPISYGLTKSWMVS